MTGRFRSLLTGALLLLIIYANAQEGMANVRESSGDDLAIYADARQHVESDTAMYKKSRRNVTKNRYTVSGNIRNAANGEDVIGATVTVKETGSGMATDAYGFYSISLPKGRYVLAASCTGYAVKEVSVELLEDLRLNIDLHSGTQELSEVVVVADGANARVARAEMSVERLTSKTIRTVPALIGEADVLKAIQLMPGVQATSDGTADFSVRGGGYDQNLILLDESPVYNASHLMGFFSVFNSDAIRDVTLHKGDIPVASGGRLSSLLDVRTKDGNSQQFGATGGIGIISSRLTVEGPLGDKISATLSGRRTYVDMFRSLSGNSQLSQSSLYFYDMNAKINIRLNPENRVFLSGYAGRDRMGIPIAGVDFGNKTLTARWNHIFSPKLFSNFTLVGSSYDYHISAELNERLGLELKSGITDCGVKADFSYIPTAAHSLKFGGSVTRHGFQPGEGGGTGDEPLVGRIRFAEKRALESAVYAANESNVGERLKLKYGLRYTAFGNLVDGSAVHWHRQLEPRAGAVWLLNDSRSVKISYARTVQFVQLASNAAAGSIFSLWFPASESVKPQKCDQIAAGFFQNLPEHALELSAEIYYKDMRDAVDFRDHAHLLFNERIEAELLFGRGKAYGLEVMLRKTAGRLSGWLGYTYARAERQIAGINDGRPYRTPYDRPHGVTAVASYSLSPRLTLSADWVYNSGTPVTYPTGRYRIDNQYVPIYSGRNEYRYPDYHRLDLSASWKLSRSGSRLRHELSVSLYNAYGRKNAWVVLFEPDEDRPDVMTARMIYLFTFVPSVTWNFGF